MVKEKRKSATPTTKLTSDVKLVKRASHTKTKLTVKFKPVTKRTQSTRKQTSSQEFVANSLEKQTSELTQDALSPGACEGKESFATSEKNQNSKLTEDASSPAVCEGKDSSLRKRRIKEGYIATPKVTEIRHDRPVEELVVTKFPCTYCYISFITKDDLTKHKVRSHKPNVRSGLRLCDLCGESFRGTHNWNVHQRVHTGEKPLECPQCLEKFRSSAQMRYHRERYHKEKEPTCLTCGMVFVRHTGLHSHQAVHLCQELPQCQFCLKYFAHRGSLKEHVLEKHGDSECLNVG